MKQSYIDFINEVAAVLLLLLLFAAGFTAVLGFALENTIALWAGLTPFILLLIWGITFFMRRRNEQAAHDAEFDNLIENGERIKVNLDQLVIKSNSWQQEIVRGRGTRSRNVRIDAHQNFISLDISHHGHDIHWETTLAMDPEQLRIRLAVQGETRLYYEPKTGKSFLDLRFLEKYA